MVTARVVYITKVNGKVVLMKIKADTGAVTRQSVENIVKATQNGKLNLVGYRVSSSGTDIQAINSSKGRKKSERNKRVSSDRVPSMNSNINLDEHKLKTVNSDEVWELVNKIGGLQEDYDKLNNKTDRYELHHKRGKTAADVRDEEIRKRRERLKANGKSVSNNSIYTDNHNVYIRDTGVSLTGHKA